MLVAKRLASVASVLVILSCAGARSAAIVELDQADQNGEDAPTDEVESSDATCLSSCVGRECGPNGCGGDCGACGEVAECSAEGKCVPFHCLSSKDCPGSLVCDKEAGQCVVCNFDADCPEGGVCLADHVCHQDATCQSDKECKELDMVCDLAVGKCVECLASADCEETEYCESSLCWADVCVAGQMGCEGNVALLCSPDGCCMEEKEICSSDQYCESGACFELTCTPSARWCESDVSLVCAGDGKSVATEVDCGLQGLHCFDGNCIGSVCIPEEKFCLDGATAATCLEDGKTYSTLPCGEGTHCESGLCAPVICEPASAWCDGMVATSCNATGTALAAQIDCSLETGKVCLDGVCIACVSDCGSKDCGPDGCGGFCGECASGQVCIAGKCPLPGDECDDGNDIPWDGCSDGKLSEFLLAGGQSTPRTASLTDDRFVVLQVVSSAGKNDVVATVFGKSGVKLLGPLVVAGDVGTSAQYNMVAATSDGGFVVAWTGGWEGSAQGLRWRRFHTDGSPNGVETVVLENELSIEPLPTMATLPDGRFLVAWHGWWPEVPPKSGPTTVFARLYLPDGSAAGEPFVVATGSETHDGVYAAGIPEKSRFALVYRVLKGSTPIGISGGLLDQEGAPLGEPFQVAAGGALGSSRALTALSGGSLVAAWEENVSGKDLFGRKIGSEGELSWGAFPLNSQTFDDQQSPYLAAHADGGFVAAWASKPLYESLEVRVRCFDGNGTPLSGDVKASTSKGVAVGPANPVVFGDGTTLAIWFHAGIGVMARRFDSNCVPMYK